MRRRATREMYCEGGRRIDWKNSRIVRNGGIGAGVLTVDRRIRPRSRRISVAQNHAVLGKPVIAGRLRTATLQTAVPIRDRSAGQSPRLARCGGKSTDAPCERGGPPAALRRWAAGSCPMSNGAASPESASRWPKRLSTVMHMAHCIATSNHRTSWRSLALSVFSLTAHLRSVDPNDSR